MEKPKEKKQKKEVPKKKIKAVENLAEKMKNAKTIMIVSIRGLPSSQYQKMKKDLRGKAEIQVFKKSILTRAIDATKIQEMQGLKEHIDSDTAIALSEEEAFELAAWLSENRNPVAAKAGQESPDNIKIEPGPTDLAPGPDISVLGSVGLQVGVEEGKITIKKAHTILKKGDKVNETTASVLLKLGIKPFMVGLNPSVIYDKESKKIYVGVKINKEEALANLLTAQSKALGLAQKLELITKDTIGYLLGKASLHEKALSKLSPKEEAEEKKEELNKEKEEESKEENKQDENQNKPEEESK